MLAIIVVEIMMIFEGDRLLIVNVHSHISFHVALHPRYATYTYDTFIHTYYAVYNAYLIVFCLPILTHTEACVVLCINSAAKRTFVVGSKIVGSNAFNSNKNCS
jgi:hypothetical protein